jgi:hypothetical protein
MKTSLSLPPSTSWLFPTRRQLWEGIRLFGMIVLGGMLISPLVGRLPVLGWDWYYFIYLAITLLIWPLWPLKLSHATFDHSAAFGWETTGWPVLILGLVMLAGAGNRTYHLMAAGLLVSPFLMPYNFSVLLPIIGEARGWRKILIWAFAWLTVLGVGLPWPAKYLNLLFPIGAYCLTVSLDGYLNNLGALVDRFKQYSAVLEWLRHPKLGI